MNRFLKISLSSILIGAFCIMPIQSNIDNISNSIVVSAMSEEGLQKVIQQNIDKMESINSYDAEFVIDYVAPSRDYNEVVDTLNQIQELSDSICSGISDEYDKVRALHDYVCQNVYYDHYASENTADFNTICLKNVLENKRSICAGYSNFFSALCNAQGIYCVNIRGSARTGDNPDISLDEAPTNHEWTAVWLESQSRWAYVDCTWDSQNHYFSDDDIVTDDFVSTYFDISLENISKNHKAKIVDYRNFFDAINYFEVQETTIEETILETESTTIENQTNDDTSNNIQKTSATLNSTEETSTNATTNTNDTTTQEKQLRTAENTSDTSRNIIPIVISMLVSLMCAITLRKKLKD